MGALALGFGFLFHLLIPNVMDNDGGCKGNHAEDRQEAVADDFDFFFGMVQQVCIVDGCPHQEDNDSEVEKDREPRFVFHMLTC
jgi:hypothetical protein